jgi:hypothetical protein
MWHNLKFFNLNNLPIKYTFYKYLFMGLNKLQRVEISILMR